MSTSSYTEDVIIDTESVRWYYKNECYLQIDDIVYQDTRSEAAHCKANAILNRYKHLHIDPLPGFDE